MAKLAFEHCSDDYARHRPGYPPELVSHLVAMSGGASSARVADVGAGTGIFTRLLAGAGRSVVAVDPGAAMLGHMFETDESASLTRSIRRVCASAEETGLADACVRMVTVAQAFHWFNPPYALAEFARILRPGGVLAIFWNNREVGASAFVAAFEALIAKFNPNYDREYRVQDWEGKIKATGLFDSPSYRRFEHEWRLPPGGLEGFSRSTSYIRNILSREAMVEFEAAVRVLTHEHFGDGETVIPLRTDLWTARRV